MECQGHSRAEEGWLSGIEPAKEEEVCKEKGEAEVAMDCGSVALEAGHD